MDSFRIVSSAVTDRGLSEKRPENQDSYLEMPQRGIFAVADGVGGAQAGEVASQMAVEILGEAFANQNNGDAEETLKAAIERANAAIYQMANELPQLSSMATTIVAFHLEGDIATIGHVGDSRLYRVDRDGNLHRETSDHSMVAEEVRAGRMTEEQAETHPSRNIISRALGAEPIVEVDLKTIMIEPGTAFLACSDGITRHVSDDEIRGVLNFGGDPSDICEYLKNLCYERGAEDNLTAVVVKVGTMAASVTADGEQTPIAEREGVTVATARSPFDSEARDDEFLELDTRELTIPAAVGSVKEEAGPQTYKPTRSEEAAPKAAVFRGYEEDAKQGSGSGGKVAIALGMLVLGSLIGLATYHLVLAPQPQPQIPTLEPRAANIPLSAFEENRRNVDSDPVGWIVRNAGSPQDCEDYYLLARAYILTSDFPKAREMLVEARNLLLGADPSKAPDPQNVPVLASDIAMAMAVTNDTTIQTNLRKELQAAKPTNANPAR
jgi:serine/threonine protein phosphatase PrpC